MRNTLRQKQNRLCYILKALRCDVWSKFFKRNKQTINKKQTNKKYIFQREIHVGLFDRKEVAIRLASSAFPWDNSCAHALQGKETISVVGWLTSVDSCMMILRSKEKGLKRGLKGWLSEAINLTIFIYRESIIYKKLKKLKSRHLSPVSVVLSGWECFTPPGWDTNPLQVSSQQTLVLINLPRKNGKLS